jgi:hypothetical protein
VGYIAKPIDTTVFFDTIASCLAADGGDALRASRRRSGG